MQPYTEDFYKFVEQTARQSAKEIVPLVYQLIQPKSVIDVGCGLGTWLSVFKDYGIEEILGVDGDYVDKQMLDIPQENFLPFDLKNPLKIDRQFDLVLSLEVAEHLPEECAETFVDSLTRLGSVILFSAAIPFQGGTDHINEQWQDYWAKYFSGKGYIAIDCIRKKVWQNANVDFWYSQNLLIFASQDYLESHELLKREWENNADSQLAIVHPKKYLEVVEQYLAAAKASEGFCIAAKWHEARAEGFAQAALPQNMSLKQVLLALPTVTINASKRRWKSFFASS